jgi:sporulation protein YlmC with PRC-barrel domain
MKKAILFSDLKNFVIRAKDGEIGHVKDVLFDDESWNIRYLVIDTSRWLFGQKVLISPDAFSVSDLTHDQVLVTDLTKQQIEDSPDLSEHLPVSRQYEEALHAFYGWTPYWGVPTTLAGWPYPDATITSPDGSIEEANFPPIWQRLAQQRSEQFDAHLRSIKAIKGYRIQTLDNEDDHFGQVSDAVITTDDWAVLDLVLDSNRWLPGGKQVSCSPMFVSRIAEDRRVLKVSLDKDVLLQGPEFDLETYGEKYREELVSVYVSEYLTKRDEKLNQKHPVAHPPPNI